MTPHSGKILRHALPTPAVIGLGLAFFSVVTLVHAADLPAPVLLDVPVPVNRALPAWIGEPHVVPTSYFSTLDLPLLPPDPTASLLVTVYFQEKPGGFLRVLWQGTQGTQGAQVLADSFYEGVAMPNQRSLLVPPATLIGGGTLMLQSSDPSLGIQRVKLEWLASKDALVSSQVPDLLVTSSSGTTTPASSFNGLPEPTAPGAWTNQIVTVPMTDAPVRIEQGVDFSVDLDQVPGSARIGLQEEGLPLGKHLVVWVNDQRAGILTPNVPDLLDSGYLPDADAATTYVGWRNASFYAPVSLLKTGVNSVQFSTEDDVPSLTLNSSTPATPATPEAPLAIKGLVMQLNYTPKKSTLALFPAAPIAASTPAPATDGNTVTPVPTTPDLPTPQLLSPAGADLRPVASTPDTTTP